jgi:hypothetical protein
MAMARLYEEPESDILRREEALVLEEMLELELLVEFALLMIEFDDEKEEERAANDVGWGGLELLQRAQVVLFGRTEDD